MISIVMITARDGSTFGFSVSAIKLIINFGCWARKTNPFLLHRLLGLCAAGSVIVSRVPSRLRILSEAHLPNADIGTFAGLIRAPRMTKLAGDPVWPEIGE